MSGPGLPVENRDPVEHREPAGQARRRRRWWVVALFTTAVLVAAGLELFGPRRSGPPRPNQPADWRQVFVENFDTDVPSGNFPGRRYGARWGVYPSGWKDTTRNGTYRPEEVVSVHDGVLDFRLHSGSDGPVAAALVPRLPTYGQLHGRYAVRFRSDPVAGYKLAFLLWPDSEEWPDDGEINFPEGDLDGTISAFLHHATPEGTIQEFPTGQTFASWHTAVIEWRPGQVRYELDGRTIGVSHDQVPDESMHWVLQTETSTTPGRMPESAESGHVQVDWVAAWSYRGPDAS